MQIRLQIGLEVPGRNKSKSPLLKWQYWPLAVTVLRTGCIFTTGHPLQVHAGVPGFFVGVYHFSCTAVHGSFRWVRGV
jgi:hypothetical protein